MGTFGRLFDEFSIQRAYTIERPWQQNEDNVSCIPEGSYHCKRIVSPSKGPTFTVTNVPEREHILFHVGNTIDDFQGCIGLGLELGFLKGMWALKGGTSGPAFKQFMEYLKDENEFQLTITQYKP